MSFLTLDLLQSPAVLPYLSLTDTRELEFDCNGIYSCFTCPLSNSDNRCQAYISDLAPFQADMLNLHPELFL